MILALSLPLALAVPQRAIVGVTPGDAEGLHAAARTYDGEPRGCFHSAGVCVLRFPGAAPLADLETLPGVRYALADEPMWPRDTGVPSPSPPPPPGDGSGTPECPDQWELATLQADALWDRVRGSDAPVIAIQDGGFLESHVELLDRVSGRFDYGDWDTEPEVETQVGVPAHGTFIAAMIAGVDDNDQVRAGLAPAAVLNLQKIADSDGALYYSYAISAMADLAEGDLGVRVLNYSLGSPGENQGFEDAVAGLADADILLVTAAGNCSVADCADADNDQWPLIPGSYSFDHIVTVAGTTRDDELNPYSHYGAVSVDLGAPGVDLCSAGVLSDTDAYTSGGTSYATPLVAAVAALVWEAHPQLTAVEVARVLRASALDVPGLAGKVRSGGRLDALAALDAGVPRLEAPADLFLDGSAVLGLQLAVPGAAGTGHLVLFHGPELAIDGADDWSVTPFQAGDTLSLPDAGEVQVDVPGTVLTGALDEHETRSLALALSGQALGPADVSVRLVLTSEGADYLNAPYDAGTYDPSGFLAHDFLVEVTAIGDPPTTPGDSGNSGDTGSGEQPGGCGCTPGPHAPPAWPALMLGLAALARRRLSG